MNKGKETQKKKVSRENWTIQKKERQRIKERTEDENTNGLETWKDVTLEIQIKMLRCHLKFIISAKLKNTFKLGIWFGRNS